MINNPALSEYEHTHDTQNIIANHIKREEFENYRYNDGHLTDQSG